MRLKTTLAAAAIIFSAGAVQAENSALVLGKSAFAARCAICHGADATGGGELGLLLQAPPSDLTRLAERDGGHFPFSTVYGIIVDGMEQSGHGDSEMPIWGDYFIADALEDRGVNAADAVHIAQGRVLSLVYYLESIQK